MQGREGLKYLVTGLLLAVVLTACPKKPSSDGKDAGIVAIDAGAVPTIVADANPVHGKELVAKYECNRCHDGTGHADAPQNKHCVHCHKDIVEDRFSANAASIARWKPRVKDLTDAPSLTSANKKFTRAWVERYLLQPTDLRPHLAQYMPSLAMSTADAKDIAAYLVPDPEAPEPKTMAPVGDVAKGRTLLDTKGCGFCHTFTGVSPLLTSTPPAMDAKAAERSKRLAPDLRFASERSTPTKLMAWLKDPKAVKADSDMPKIDLTDTDIKDITAYLLRAEITPPPVKPAADRLPVLTRKVTYAEVDAKVLHRTCWHCHSEPDYAIGDGGPGNSGGFGFKPRGLNLSEYAGIAAGYLDEKNERQSIFAKDAEGVPVLVRALLARHEEERGAPTGPVRGMPLGYEALSLEDIQLVETWVSQGRPR